MSEEMTNKIIIKKDGTSLSIGNLVEYTTVDIMRHDPENPIPHSEIAGRPDAGFGGTRIRFAISVSISRTEMIDGELINADNNKLKKLIEWVNGEQTGVDGFGIFSLEHSELPGIDVTAHSKGGYKLVNLHLEVSHQIPDRITGYLDMQLDGKLPEAK